MGKSETLWLYGCTINTFKAEEITHAVESLCASCRAICIIILRSDIIVYFFCISVTEDQGPALTIQLDPSLLPATSEK